MGVGPMLQIGLRHRRRAIQSNLSTACFTVYVTRGVDDGVLSNFPQNVRPLDECEKWYFEKAMAHRFPAGIVCIKRAGA